MSKTLKIPLPPSGRSRELLRTFVKSTFHGEIVVTLNSKGDIDLTVYSIEREANGNLKHVTYKVI